MGVIRPIRDDVVIQIPVMEVIEGTGKRRLDGGLKQTKNNYSTTQWVDPIRDKKDIARVEKYLREQAMNAKTDCKKLVGWRNWMLFLVGINVGLRVSDLINLKWSHIYEKDMRTFVAARTKSEKKTGKYRNIYPNDMIKYAVSTYLKETGQKPDYDDYLFVKTNGKPISDGAVEKLIRGGDGKGGFAGDLKLVGNYNTHSLRKTFAYQKFMMLSNQGDPMALIKVQTDLNHRNSSDTARYLGITREDSIRSSNELSDFLGEMIEED